MDSLTESFDDIKVSAFTKTKYLDNRLIAALQYSKQQTEQSRPKLKPKTYRKLPKTMPDTSCNLVHKRNLMEFEKRLNDQIQLRLSARITEIVNFDKQQEQQLKDNWLLQQRRLIDEMQQQEAIIYQSIEQYNRETTDEHQKLDKYYRELAETQQKVLQEMQQKERRKQYVNLILDSIKKNQMEFREVYQDIVNLLKTGGSGGGPLPGNLSAEIVQDLRLLHTAMDEIFTSCRNGKVTDEVLKKSEDVTSSIKIARSRAQQIVDYLNNKPQQEDIVDTSTANEPETPQAEAAEPSRSEQERLEVVPSNEQEADSVLFDANSYVSKRNFKIYFDYQQFCQSYQDNYKSLLGDINYKKFRIDCMKAVNMPVNAISDANAQHLQSKYLHLKNLLAGQTVLMGDQQINATKHPQGIFYCKDLLAVMFVKQADNLVSSNQTQPFCYAAIITALWNDYPDFGKLILAHFHQKCPYLVPFYLPRGADQTDREFYMSRGYTYDSNGAIEKQDKFLRRMTGMVRLYAAILISKPKKNQGKPNPHGISNAWIWLASMLNLEPEFDITATVLHEFLVMTGSTMQAVYGKMFAKLIDFLIKVYMPKMRKIDTGGPSSRLNILLENYLKEGRFQEPPGILPGNFW